METLQRTKSDISSLLLHAKDTNDSNSNSNSDNNHHYKHLMSNLPTLSEVAQATCECCGMSEECTAEYIEEMREKYSGKLICGLCAEAVKEEMEKNGGRTREEALEEHMNICVKFNRIGKAYPILYQADAVKKLLKKSCSANDKSNNNNSKGGVKKGGLARSSSCMPAIAENLDKLRF